MRHDDDAPPHDDADAPANVTPIGAAKKKRKPRVSMASGVIVFELDVARRLIELHGDDLRFATGIGWLVWTGTHWQRDTSERSRELVKNVIDRLRGEAAVMADDDLWKLAQKTGSARGITAVLDLARSDPRVRISVDDLDKCGHLLACINGVIDLRSGELREHRREDLLTRCAPTAYDPDATHEPLERLLVHLVPDDDARAYLQRAIGYSLSASPIEDVIMLLVGPPRCGKGTLLRAMREAFGEHYTESAMASFCLDGRTGGNGARSDLFRLIGRRIVAASEIHPGQEFDVGRLKGIAGGDRLPVRDLHKSEIEAPVTFVLWLVANDGDLPRMRAEDEAIWERIRRIPVGSTVPEGERDPALREGMASPEARAATLAWSVRGAVEWHRDGLGSPPVAVREAGAELRTENDPIASFAAAALTFGPTERIARRALREALEAWIEGGRAPSGKRVAAGLRAAGAREGVEIVGCSVRDGAKVRDGWRGVRLATEAEREQREERESRGVATSNARSDIQPLVRGYGEECGSDRYDSLPPYPDHPPSCSCADCRAHARREASEAFRD